MKIIACSKLQAGKSPSNLPNRIVSVIKNSGADALLVAGDLFCDHLFDEDVYNSLYNSFSAVPEVSVFICPGASDPYMPDSPYILKDWPENVHIFKGRMKAFEVAPGRSEGPAVRVYGIGAVRHNPKVFPFDPNRLPKTDKAFLNILLLNGLPEAALTETGAAVFKDGAFDALVFGSAAAAESGAPNGGFVPVPPAVDAGGDGTFTVLSGTVEKGRVSFTTEVIRNDP